MKCSHVQNEQKTFALVRANFPSCGIGFFGASPLQAACRNSLSKQNFLLRGYLEKAKQSKQHNKRTPKPIVKYSPFVYEVTEKAMAPHSSTLAWRIHGQRSLVGCSPWGLEESDTTEWLHFHFSLSCIGEGNGNPLQYSCLENPRDGGARWAAVYGVAELDTTETT